MCGCRPPDGAMVPVSIVAPRGTAHDGHHPTMMYAYGAYGATLSPAFERKPARVVRPWRHLCRGACARQRRFRRRLAPRRAAGREAQQHCRLHRSRRLPGEGTAGPRRPRCPPGAAARAASSSAAPSRQRPKLFSAALIEVGLLNMLRLEQIPIGPFNTGEFGSTETEEGVRMLAAIDAYQQIRDHVAYPGVLVATGRNDARVSPWMPAKFAARLQAATAGPRPVLLRVNDAGGHGGGTRDQAAGRGGGFLLASCFGRQVRRAFSRLDGARIVWPPRRTPLPRRSPSAFRVRSSAWSPRAGESRRRGLRPGAARAGPATDAARTRGSTSRR